LISFADEFSDHTAVATVVSISVRDTAGNLIGTSTHTWLTLSLAKIPSGVNAFEISDIQEEKPTPANLPIGM
jgi:hypothetical protein